MIGYERRLEGTPWALAGAIIVLLFVSRLGGGGMMGGGMIGALFILLFWGLLIALIVALVVFTVGQSQRR